MNQPVSRRGALALCGAGALSLLGAGALVGCSEKGSDAVTVGSKAFTEGVILSELYALALEDAGLKVNRSFEISGSLIHTALESGDIDLYPEYTGTGLISVLKMDPITDPDAAYDTVKDEYEKQFDLVWLDKSEAADGQAWSFAPRRRSALASRPSPTCRRTPASCALPARASSTSGPTACPRWRPSTAPLTGRTTPSSTRASNTRCSPTTRWT